MILFKTNRARVKDHKLHVYCECSIAYNFEAEVSMAICHYIELTCEISSYLYTPGHATAQHHYENTRINNLTHCKLTNDIINH